MKYYPHHIGDYRSATGHLSNDEDICYRRLLDRYYDTEQPLDDDVRLLARFCKVTQTVVTDILNEFFTLREGKWHSGRADAEIIKWYEASAAAKAKADARWSKQRSNAAAMQRQCSGNAETMLEPCCDDAETMLRPCCDDATQYPIPNTQVNPSSNPAGFDAFWAAYPKKIGKQAAVAVWKRKKVNGLLPNVLKAIEAQKATEQWKRDGGQYIPNPATWLSQGRWDDEVESPAGQRRNYL
jgi:uncharacterized protein YdaU (DUF1376 family)